MCELSHTVVVMVGRYRLHNERMNKLVIRILPILRSIMFSCVEYLRKRRGILKSICVLACANFACLKCEQGHFARVV